jgi:hypothetical protein
MAQFAASVTIVDLPAGIRVTGLLRRPVARHASPELAYKLAPLQARYR